MVYTKTSTSIAKFAVTWICSGFLCLLFCSCIDGDLEAAQSSPADPDRLGHWIPLTGDRLQIQYADYPVDLGVEADIFAVDLFETPEDTIQQLHANGKKVICYVSTGSWEEYRPDKDEFPENVIGKDYEGWPGEKWLDISRYEQFADIMLARFDLAKAKGCDGIDADNMQNYEENTGFVITSADQLTYNLWLSEQAHNRNLSIGLKNDPKQAADLVDAFDWALIEDCSMFGWCNLLQPFTKAGKPVFQVDYTDNYNTLNDFCPQAVLNGYSGILKNRELDAWIEFCR